MLSMRALDIQGPARGSRTYVRWETSLEQLKEQASRSASVAWPTVACSAPLEKASPWADGGRVVSR